MNCNFCRSPLKEGQTFCPNCGASVENTTESTVSEVSNQSSVTPVTNVNTVSNSSVPKKEKKPKNKKNKLLIILIAVFVLLACALGGISYYMSTPKQIFKSIINKAFNTAIDTIKSDETSSIVTFDLKANVKMEGDIADDFSDEYYGIDPNELLAILNNLSISGKIGFDRDNKLAQIELDSKYEGANLVSGGMYFQDEKAYISLDGIYDKHISTEIEDYDTYFEDLENKDDYVLVLKKLKKAVGKSLKDEYFEQEKEDGLTKNTLIVDEETFSEILLTILEELADDEDFIESFAVISEMDEDEIEEMLDEAIEDLEDIEEYDDTVEFQISIYTKGLFNKFQKLEVVMEEEDYYGDKNTIKIIFEREDKENYSFKMVQNKETMMSGKVKVVEEKDKTSVSGSVTVEGITIGVDFSYSVDTKTKLSAINVDNSIDVEDVTDQDGETILNNLQNIEGFKKIEEDIKAILPQDKAYTIKSYDDLMSATVYVPFDYEVYNSTYYLSLYGDKYDVSYSVSNYNTIDDEASFYVDYYGATVSELKTVTVDGVTYNYKDVVYDTGYYYSSTKYIRILTTELGNGYRLMVEVKSYDGLSDIEINRVL